MVGRSYWAASGVNTHCPLLVVVHGAHRRDRRIPESDHCPILVWRRRSGRVSKHRARSGELVSKPRSGPGDERIISGTRHRIIADLALGPLSFETPKLADH